MTITLSERSLIAVISTSFLLGAVLAQCSTALVIISVLFGICLGYMIEEWKLKCLKKIRRLLARILHYVQNKI
ncbi:hypothetical protein X975_27136, partial [Stegodyphus mimosarum]